MKKLGALILAMVMLLCLVACAADVAPDDQLKLENESAIDNGNSQSVSCLKEPPAAQLLYGYGSVPLSLAGYVWHYPIETGAMSGTKADGLHPLDPEARMEPVAVSGEQVKLEFENMPDSVQVRCWPDTTEDTNAQPETVNCSDYAFDLKKGGYIYEIVASWKEKENSHFGTAHYYAHIVFGEAHEHSSAANPQIVDDPITGYCGNTWTTLHLNGKDYRFMYGNSVTLTDILVNLRYDPDMVCNCPAEFTVDTEFGSGYEVNLAESFVRCEKGQAVLTREQVDTIAKIIYWAETTNCQYPL